MQHWDSRDNEGTAFLSLTGIGGKHARVTPLGMKYDGTSSVQSFDPASAPGISSVRVWPFVAYREFVRSAFW
jgi:hypothetical protein